jgi:hypothetical protein
MHTSGVDFQNLRSRGCSVNIADLCELEIVDLEVLMGITKVGEVTSVIGELLGAWRTTLCSPLRAVNFT